METPNALPVETHTVEVVPLGYGLVALLTCSDAEPPAAVRTKRPGARRDPATGHLWQTCACASCRLRQAADAKAPL